MATKIGNDMSEQKKFKVGDRVRFTRKDCHWIETSIHNGDEGVVIGDGSGYFPNSVDVNFSGVSDEISVNDLELVESYDPTTDFLTRLQSLLREFDAEIRFVEDDYSPAIIFMGHKDETTRFGKFVDGVVLYSNHGCISADSVMDYDKE